MTETEVIVRNIVADVLVIDNKEEISIDDRFFDIGGNSLTAMMVVEQIQDYYMIDFDFSCLINHSTIRKISELIDEKKGNKNCHIGSDGQDE